ncbi:hypothetical protein VHUM_01006 [Vanrija humicola]|uniref:Rhodanese domain-containing protein n=1 Tax=Vanrija humicola TaxID=5417 RepID=A0A7D8V457_VANHU|nr:hypothetical protein VHUM_01006 [Vanrija humicola]
MSQPKYRYISADVRVLRLSYRDSTDAPPQDLAAILKSEPEGAFKSWAVIDVRDSDFAGGNIVGAANYPSESFLAEVDALVRRAENEGTLTADCALSQVRGPKAARRYAEAREFQLKDAAPAQEILVLRQGFEGFQSRYRDDKALVEKFNKFYHD